MANKRRLIDANAFEWHLMQNASREDICDDCLQYVTDELMTAPAVDAVEVVRCKDCVFYTSATGFCHYHSKEYDGGEYWDKFGSDDFCSRGERTCDNGE